MKTTQDSPWKLMLDNYFQQVMIFFWPKVADEIDWSKPYITLDKELLKIQKHSNVGNKLADKLLKVFKKNGEETWLIVHIEIQGTKEDDFSRRMFEYYYKVYDRYKKPLMSCAVLTDTDPKWRPQVYEQELWGSNSFLDIYLNLL